jgi:hypothetical protein
MENDLPVDVELLRKEMNKRPKFQAALKMLSKRKRGRFQTTFRVMRRELEADGASWSPEEVAEFFKVWENAGAGTIVYGGDTPRFLWNYNLLDLACLVKGTPLPARKLPDGTFGRPKLSDLRRPSPERKQTPRLGEASTKSQRAIFSPASPVPLQTENGRKLMQLVREFIGEIDVTSLKPDAMRKMTEILLLLSVNSA